MDRICDFACLRFNRYIVECKVNFVLVQYLLYFWFNRYIVECKACQLLCSLGACFDLIDTLWNVKLLRRPVLQPAPRFNRYIVECKDIWQKGYVIVGSGFNRYIVECKGSHWNSNIRTFLRFNRYIVECKDLCSICIRISSTRFNRYIVECKMAYGRKSETLIDQ